MNTTPKLIALDLDGTLLDSAGMLSDRAVAAIESVTAAGHRVVLATGRPPHIAIPVTERLMGTVEHIVGGNGSIISTFPATQDSEPELLHLIGFPLSEATAAVLALREHDTEFGFALATDNGFAHESGFAELMPAAVHADGVADALSIGGTQAFKLLAYHSSMSVHELIDVVPTIIDAATESELHVSHMGADAVEIGPADADKCTGVQWLCEHLGVDVADVIAIGDEWNDLTMLEWAGRGIAMGNADERVQAVADEVTTTNDNDGVALVLESLLN
ncbi:MAG: HAD family hydrolase [Ilumatobacter sp.]